MKDWRSTYGSKVVSAEEAIRVVKSRDRVVFGHACAEPPSLVEALMRRAPELSGVEIVHMVNMGPAKFARPGMERSFRYNGLFVGGPTRSAIDDGRGDYTPCFFSEVPRLFKQDILGVDVALIQLTPPDEQGYCSFGLSADYTVAAAESARVVVAQINRKMPRTSGARIHVSKLTYIVEKDDAIPELAPATLTTVERRIGEFVAELVPDGATLQMGIGAIPDAALFFMMDKHDLGIHSEMFSDGVVELARAGVVTNRCKTINQGKFIATFLMGSRKLYDFVDGNPDVELWPVDYTNDPCVIGQHDNMISINSAIQVDLMGQVNAEMIGSTQYSGVGGQVDFVRGTGRSRGGKSIIALPSTACGGTVSRICRELDAGAAVTTSRNDVHYVVTEYGIADLRGKTVRQRAEALISIAHPSFRSKLRGQQARVAVAV